jgi:hypothetical protein
MIVADQSAVAIAALVTSAGVVDPERAGRNEYAVRGASSFSDAPNGVSPKGKTRGKLSRALANSLFEGQSHDLIP